MSGLATLAPPLARFAGMRVHAPGSPDTDRSPRRSGSTEHHQQPDQHLGLSPDEQLKNVEIFSQQIEVSVEARVRAEARAAELGAQLGFTRDAVIGFFRILGEQDVSPEQIPLKLGEIAARHRAMLDRWSVLDTADPATATLAAEAKRRSTAVITMRLTHLLVRTEEQDAAAARQAEQLARDAQQAAERRWLNAAEKEGKRGDLAMTRLRYADAAQRYAAAAKHSANIAPRRAARFSGAGSWCTLPPGRRAGR